MVLQSIKWSVLLEQFSILEESSIPEESSILGQSPVLEESSILEESQHEQFAHQMMESNEGLQVFIAGWFLLGMVLFMLISVYLVYWCFLGRHRMMVEDLAMSAELKYKINEERQKKTN